MADNNWVEVDRFIASLFVEPDATLNAALKASEAAGLPAIEVSPNQGKLLMLLARSIGARRILEIGTLGGYSTIWLARALPSNGRLVTLEADRKHADVARKNIAEAGFGEIVDIRIGAALDNLPKIEAEKAGPFDLVFIDADKPNNPAYFAWALKLARPGSLIVADNVVRYGALVDEASQDPRVRGVRNFMEIIAAEKRVSATAIQTVGVKGHDGFAIALVNEL
jgi:predicted O-methyltransferase YrrM